MRSRLKRNANLDSSVAADLHVLFPRVIACKTRFAVAGITCRCGTAFGLAPDAEPFQQRAIEANIELLRPTHALEVILILTLQSNFDEILAVHWKVVPNRNAAARAEW